MSLRLRTAIRWFRSILPKSLGCLLGRRDLALPDDVERAELAFYISFLRPGMIAFDVGANVGFMTLLFSRLVGLRGKVHAFEAGSTAFGRLQTTCQTAGQSNVILNHLALAEREGIRKLYTYSGDHLSWSSLAARPLEKYGLKVTAEGIEDISTITVDAYCERNCISRIDLLKIDVEGAEYQVLIGARKMLQEKRIRCCIFEFGQTTFDMGNDPNQIEDFLKHLGYRIRNVVKGNPVFPGRSNAMTARYSMHVAMPNV